MGKPKSKGGIDAEEGAEEEDEKERVAGHPQVLIETDKDERKVTGGAGPGVADPAPTPAPRKRGRPRKVVPKVEENSALVPQQSTAAADSESKKLKKTENSSGLNGTPSSNQQSSIGAKLSTCAPLRREGSRRKSEPRRAAD